MNYTDLEANLVDNPGGGIRECRICLDTEVAAGDEFIAPCRCKGSSKWIHRKCLDSWRATKHTDRAFTHCRECQFEYRVRVIDPNTEGGAFCNARCKFRALVARDSLFAFLLLQSMICGIGLIFKALDTKNEDVRKLLPHFINHGEKSGYYVWGLIGFLAVLGLGGLISLCVNGPSQLNARDGDCCCCCDNRGGNCNYIYCGDCNCGDCRCNGGDDALGALVIIALVVILCLAFLGIFVGIFSGTLLLQRIIQRHNKVLWLRAETIRYFVLDLDGINIDLLPDCPVMERRASLNSHAPSAPDFDALGSYRRLSQSEDPDLAKPDAGRPMRPRQVAPSAPDLASTKPYPDGLY